MGYAEVLSFWFGELDEHGLAEPSTAARWFRVDPSFDEALRERFLDVYVAIAERGSRAWLDAPRGRLAAVIVLDQFARNMFRGTSGMFAADPLARSIASDAIERGDERELRVHERVFLYMPFMHSESLADQHRCVALFAALLDELEEPAKSRIARNHHYAVLHRDIVARWGRFPHRNAILGRDSTPEELAFLQQPNSSF